MSGIDFGKIAATNASRQLLHPRDIFNALPSKGRAYDYLRGPQDQVLAQWFDKRDARDSVVKLNTGGGKTVVGLLIARSCLNEGKGPVAYLTPDHYLANQVRDEADRLGISTTDSARSYAYSSGEAVLVDVFQRLFNGQSIFGVSGSVPKAAAVSVGSVIVDDAHSCLSKAEQTFRMVIPSSESAYGELLDLFDDAIDGQSPAGLMALRSSRPSAIQQVPYWSWADRQARVLEILHPITNEPPYLFAWPLIVDALPVCRAIFTADALEIAAPCLPVQSLIGFQRAKRRIYLTATLADDGILVTDFAADESSVSSPIVPASAGDIGDRLILIPEQTHPDADPAIFRKVILALARERNVVVIVPSRPRAKTWEDDAVLVLDKDNLSSGVEQLRANPTLGLVVLINRYDGVDLPGDACNVLVVDGLPEALDAVDRLDQAQLLGSDVLVARQVQRLEQGMGRATRSNEDHCVVILLGARLAERLYGESARRSFSPATRAQLELSDAVAQALKEMPVSSLNDVIRQCLDRDPAWVAASRGALAPLKYEPARLAGWTVRGRKAFDLAAAGEYRRGVEELNRAIGSASDDQMKGYLQQQAAAYLHMVNAVEAQQLQLTANRRNRSLLRPMDGVRYEKLLAPTLEQGAAASAWLQAHYSGATELALGFNSLVADLQWGPRTNAFEQAWSDLAWHIGWAGQRPEQDTGRGPDGLWAMNSGQFIITEAKSNTSDGHPVYKSDAEQLSNAMDWFRGEYPGITGTPLLVHPSQKFHRQAAVPLGCRIVTTRKLESLIVELKRLSAALSDADAYRDPVRTGQLLHAHSFTAAQFMRKHTSAAIPGA